jgi:acylphosphatase
VVKKRDLVITIDPDGNVKIEVEGVAGKDCMDFTAWLEAELGDVTDRQFTSSYYQEEEEAETTVDVGSK